MTYVTRGRGNSVLPRSCPPSLSSATRRWSTPKTAGSRRSGWPTSTLVARQRSPPIRRPGRSGCDERFRAVRRPVRPESAQGVGQARKPVACRIVAAVDALKANPRPSKSRPLVGYPDQWRLRVGDYRVVYTIKDAQLMILAPTSALCARTPKPEAGTPKSPATPASSPASPGTWTDSHAVTRPARNPLTPTPRAGYSSDGSRNSPTNDCGAAGSPTSPTSPRQSPLAREVPDWTLTRHAVGGLHLWIHQPADQSDAADTARRVECACGLYLDPSATPSGGIQPVA